MSIRRVRKSWARAIGLALVRTIGPTAARLSVGTCRARIEGWDRVEALQREGHAVIFALWHNRLLAPTWFFRRRKIHVLVSRHGDGALIAGLLERLGYVAVRGSVERRRSRRKGGVRALHALAKVGRSGGLVAFTPDGPKGPIYSIAPGLAALARLSACDIVPVGVETSRHWTLGSWDRFRIPKPLCRGAFVFGEPIRISGDRDADDALVREGMDRAAHRAASLIGVEDPYVDADSRPVAPQSAS